MEIKSTIVYNKCGHKYQKTFTGESIEILKIFGLISNIVENQKTYNHVWRTNRLKT